MQKITRKNDSGRMVTYYVGSEENVARILAEVKDPDTYTVSEATTNNRRWFVGMVKRVTLKALLAQAKIHGTISYDDCFTAVGISEDATWKAYFDNINSGSSNRSWNPVLWHTIKTYKTHLLGQL